MGIEVATAQKKSLPALSLDSGVGEPRLSLSGFRDESDRGMLPACNVVLTSPPLDSPWLRVPLHRHPADQLVLSLVAGSGLEDMRSVPRLFDTTVEMQ